MGEPIHLPDGTIVYGRAQAAIMQKAIQTAQDGQGGPIAPEATTTALTPAATTKRAYKRRVKRQL